ncbi:MAG: hypothetical protein JF613_02960 [Acidobacteria bacterium]|nr:hypothetical protein [Acidobacteriota bacterium]
MQDLFRRRPVEQRLERLPVFLEVGLQAVDVLLRRAGERTQFGHGRHVLRAERGQLMTVLGRALAGDVEQVVADEDPGEVDIRPQPAEFRIDVVMVRVQLIELAVDRLRLAGEREHRHDDQQQQAAQAERGDRPRSEPHVHSVPGSRPRRHPVNTGCHCSSAASAVRPAPA